MAGQERQALCLAKFRDRTARKRQVRHELHHFLVSVREGCGDEQCLGQARHMLHAIRNLKLNPNVRVSKQATCIGGARLPSCSLVALQGNVEAVGCLLRVRAALA